MADVHKNYYDCPEFAIYGWKNKENIIYFYEKRDTLYEAGTKYPAKDKYNKGVIKSQVLKRKRLRTKNHIPTIINW